MKNMKKINHIALWLVGICIIIFFFQKILGITDLLLLDKTITPLRPWQFLTSIFAHANLGHLLSNMFALALFGSILEQRIGTKKFFWLFIGSGIVINLFSPYPRSLGASGAIYGVLGALVILRPWMMVWVSGMPVPMFLAGLIWLFIDVAGVYTPSSVANLAHVYGLLIGVCIAFFWRKKYGDRFRKKHGWSSQEYDIKKNKWIKK